MPSMFGHSTPRFHVLLTHRTDSNPNLHGTIHEDLLHLRTLMLLEPKVLFLLLPSRVYHMAIRNIVYFNHRSLLAVPATIVESASLVSGSHDRISALAGVLV